MKFIILTVDGVIYIKHCQIRVDVDEPVNLRSAYSDWNAEVAYGQACTSCVDHSIEILKYWCIIINKTLHL